MKYGLNKSQIRNGTSIGKESLRGAAGALSRLWVATALVIESIATGNRRLGVAVPIGAQNCWRWRTECLRGATAAEWTAKAAESISVRYGERWSEEVEGGVVRGGCAGLCCAAELLSRVLAFRGSWGMGACVWGPLYVFPFRNSLFSFWWVWVISRMYHWFVNLEGMKSMWI